MPRRRRTEFVAPFIVTIAAACSHDAGRGNDLNGKKVVSRYYVQHTGDRCSATAQVDCPPDVTCNPPMPMEYACPGFPADHAQVISTDGTTCTIDGTATVVKCPTNEPPIDAPPPPVAQVAIDAAPAPVLRSWFVHNGGKACDATENVICPRGPNGEIPTCNPPASSPVACAPFGTKDGRIQEIAPGSCQVVIEIDCPPNRMCNPPPAAQIACPR
jgi:hypothetical protein